MSLTKTKLQEKLESGKFAVTAEMGPPKGPNPGDVLSKVEYLRKFDAINVTDNQLGVCRMSAIAASRLLLDHGLEPTPQITLRDRNSIGLQSDLLGAYALGIRNILCLTGDHPRFGNHPDAKPVFEMTIIDFLAKVKTFGDGFFFNNERMKDSGPFPKFFVGAACNPFTGGGVQANMERMRKKIDAGAVFFQTQPVFDVEAFNGWMSAMREAGLAQKCYILAGVMPVRSAKSMRYLAEKVPGTKVPSEFIERMDAGKKPDEEGKTICAKIIKKLKGVEGIAGIHMMSMGWESSFAEIMELAELEV